MLKIVVVSITYRTLNNIAAALHLAMQRGADCRVIWLPTTQRIEGQVPSRLGFDTVIDAPGVKGDDAAALQQLREQVRALLVATRPDLVVSDDMTNWPNRLVREVLLTLPERPWHVAWQHGLYQPWYAMRQRFDADYFFCYGAMHTTLLGPALWSRVLPVGLPKLDLLQQVKTHSGGYLSWFCQPAPAYQRQLELLQQIAATGARIRVRPHPALPDAFAAAEDPGTGITFDDPATDPIDALAGCDALLTTHSSALLEALLLGKPTVLFPSFGLTSLVGYPSVAQDFTAAAYQVVARRQAGLRAATNAFLDDAIGGRRFDHARRGADALEALAALRRAGLPQGKVDWWREDGALRSLVAGMHPLVPARGGAG